MRETWVRSLGWEDPLEKEIATHSSILAWRIPWREEPGGLHTVHGVAELDTTEQLHFYGASKHLIFAVALLNQVEKKLWENIKTPLYSSI